MTFGTRWEAIGTLGQKEANALVHRSIDAGVNFFDTADVYSTGDSEEILGRALTGRRQDVIIATKVRGRMGPGANDVGLSRLHIIQAAEASLKRLGTDYIDLYQIHRNDPVTDIEETLSALTDLVRAGKVRYIGCSNLPAWQLMKAIGIARQRGLESFKATQSYYALVGRELEQETIPLIRDQNLGRCWCGVRWPADSSPESSRGAEAARRTRGARHSTFRRLTRSAGSTLSTRCNRLRKPTWSRLPRWLWPGCWAGTR